MTDREREERLEEDLRRARRGRRLVVTAGVVVCFIAAAGLAGSIVANVVNVNQGADITNVHNDVTKIQKSACTAHPNGNECQQTKRRSDEAASLPTLCVQFRRVDREHRLLRLTRCRDEDLARRSTSPVRGGDASQSPTSATQQAAPGTSPAHTGGRGGSTPQATAHSPSPPGQSPAPSSSGETGTSAGQTQGAAAPTSTSSSSSTTVTEPQQTVAPEAAPEEHPAREVLGTVTAPVGGTVETVTGKACEATGLLCTK